MKPLAELIDGNDPAWPVVQDWIARAVRPIEVLAPSEAREDALLNTQVTTRSTMGAVVYETGGILVDHGWLRILGSGHPRLTRTLPGWNAGRADGFYLVADDAVGGFFALNGGALGGGVKDLFYFAPDSLKWEPVRIGYSAFLQWVCTGRYDQYCESQRWPGWEAEVAKLSGDRCLMSYPPLWTVESKGTSIYRGEVAVAEIWSLQLNLKRQLEGQHETNK